MEFNHPETLRVLFPREYPYNNPNCSKFPHFKISYGCPRPGLLTEIFNIIADHLNTTIVPSFYDDNDAGFHVVHDNKIIGEFTRKVFDGNVDTIAAPFQMDDVRKGIFDFSVPLYSVELNILHGKKTVTTHDYTSFFSVYDNYCLAVLALILVLQSIFYVFNQHLHSNDSRITFWSVVDSIWLATQIQLGQSVMIVTKACSAVKYNFLIISVFQGIIIMGVYSSWILSQKYIGERIGDYNNVKELIKDLEDKNRYFVATSYNDWFYGSLNNSEAYPFKEIKNALKRNPVRIAKDNFEALEETNTKGGLIAVTEDDLITYLSRQYCGFGKLEDPLAMVTAHLIFRKENNIVTIVNEAIQKNKMLIERAFRKYRDHSALRTASGHCKKPKIAGTKPFYGLFFAWAALMIASTICFLIEFSVTHLGRANVNKPPQLTR